MGGRAYRYRVESYRDPASGKVRGRWTYLGKADGGTPVARRRPLDTRARLLAAFGRLLESMAYPEISAGRIAEEAGLAHGTFYRYFSDKPAAFRAALAELRERVDSVVLAFGGPLGTVAEERERVRGWLRSLFAVTIERPGFLRAAYTLTGLDPVARDERRERRRSRVAELAAYISRLNEARLIVTVDPERLANALVAAIDGLLRLAVLEELPIDDAAVAGVIALYDRAIFGPQAAKN